MQNENQIIADIGISFDQLENELNSFSPSTGNAKSDNNSTSATSSAIAPGAVKTETADSKQSEVVDNSSEPEKKRTDLTDDKVNDSDLTLDSEDEWIKPASTKLNQSFDPLAAATGNNGKNTTATEVVPMEATNAAQVIQAVNASNTPSVTPDGSATPVDSRAPLPSKPVNNNQPSKRNYRKAGVIVVVIIILLTVVGVYFKGTGSSNNQPQKAESSRPAQQPTKITRVNTGDPYTSSTLGIGRGRDTTRASSSSLWPSQAVTKADATKFEPVKQPSKPPSYVNAPMAAPNQINSLEKAQSKKSNGFVVSLNETESVNAKAESSQQKLLERASTNSNISQSRIAPGTRLPLMLLEPFRSGIATTITCQLTGDITDTQGNLIPAGTQMILPFLPFEVNGRIINDNSANAFLLLPNGTKLAVKGLIKGPDGFAGLSGKVKKFNGGNIISRLGRGLARVAGRTTGVGTSGIDGGALEGAITDSTASPNGSVSISGSSRVVEVSQGTRFTFNVAG